MVRHGDIIAQQYDIVWGYLLMEEIIQNSQDRNIPSSDSIYPLENFHIPMENHHAFFMGKSTISMTIFNSKLLVYQRVLRLVCGKTSGNPKDPIFPMSTPVVFQGFSDTGVFKKAVGQFAG